MAWGLDNPYFGKPTTVSGPKRGGTGGRRSGTGTFADDEKKKKKKKGKSKVDQQKLYALIRKIQDGGDLPDISDPDILGAPVNARHSDWLRYGMAPGTGGHKQAQLGKLLAELVRMKGHPDQVASLQKRLWDAGYYASSLYTGDNFLKIKQGNADDPYTRTAYTKLLLDGVMHASYDDGVTLDDLLADGASSFAGAGGLGGGGGGGGGGGAVESIQLSDPAYLKELADQVAENVLGRKLTPEDKDKYVHLVQAAEAGQQHAEFAAQEGQRQTAAGTDSYVPSASVTTEDVNPQGRITEAVKTDFATEAGAHDIGNVYDEFRQLIGSYHDG